MLALPRGPLICSGGRAAHINGSEHPLLMGARSRRCALHTGIGGRGIFAALTVWSVGCWRSQSQARGDGFKVSPRPLLPLCQVRPLAPQSQTRAPPSANPVFAHCSALHIPISSLPPPAAIPHLLPAPRPLPLPLPLLPLLPRLLLLAARHAARQRGRQSIKINPPLPI